MNKRVGIIVNNSPECVDAILDIWNNGDCAVLIDWRIPYAVAVEMMKEASIVKCYAENKVVDKLKDTCTDIDFATFEQKSFLTEVLPLGAYDKFQANYSQNEAIIIYSSGTTGKSKGIILSHYAINKNADAIIEYMQITQDDVFYIVRPIAYAASMVGELLVCLKAKAKLYIGPVIVPPRYVISNLMKYNVTILTANPTQLSMYADELINTKTRFTHLRCVYASGSILNNVDRLKAIKAFEGVSIYNAYGLTEAGPRVSAQIPGFDHDNSVGKPISGVDVLIIDEQGNTCAPSEKGVIHVKTESIFSGYVKGTAKLQSLYNDWFNTGDIGYMDENGELYVVGRMDDLVNVHGHKVYLCDIEKIIREYESIKDCAVICENDKSNDPVIICFYELYDNDNFDLDLVIKHCKKYLSQYEVPKRWTYVESMPKTLNNKISKSDIVDLFNN